MFRRRAAGNVDLQRLSPCFVVGKFRTARLLVVSSGWCREVSILALVKSGSCVWKFPSKQNVPNVSAGIASRSSYMSVQLGLSWKMSDVSVVISGISLRVVGEEVVESVSYRLFVRVKVGYLSP